MSSAATRLRVLVVGNDAGVGLMIRAALGDDYSLAMAEDVHEAQAIARFDQPALILIDGGHVGSSLDELRRLRAEPASSEIPVVLLVEAPFPKEASEELEALASGHLTKPVEPVELGNLVGCVLGRTPRPVFLSALRLDHEDLDTLLDSESSAGTVALALGEPLSADRSQRGEAVAQVGEQLGGRYVVRSVLGRGGMGEVYLVWDEEEGIHRALKALRRDRSLRGVYRRRFLEEARITAALAHDHVVPVHDFGTTPDGRWLLVTEYCSEGTLADLLRREGRLAPERAVRLALQLLAALAHSHRRGVVHRDIKPANLTVDGRDHLRLLDFGLARDLFHSVRDLARQVGSAIGTPIYMSPESIRGEPLDQRTDVYGVGMVLYEMLAGGTPFDVTSSPRNLMRANLEERPRPLSQVAGVSSALDAGVLKALAKDRRERWQTAGEFADALASALVEERAAR